MIDLEEAQKQICSQFSAPYYGCDLALKVGVSRNLKEGIRPINGMRISPDKETSGWYIWAGENLSTEEDFFVPLHGIHLQEWAPLVLPFLGLPPGWRFLVTEHYRDVWSDKELK
ncbi:immunity protein Imm33 domain-containing protein [Methylosinus trichosporium]|uniref:Imm33-like domain-containing protein n=1 Tax=Methylosinus trichosporium (strain ATCC 35070 / NCIMB 11131 / UNIQEM 75 / OB3b) TaxID=595536 RepID=A0A2D2D7U3_METT3|nr:hypothetical protein CQW49_23635 [Methylosinus trichosporium OB3b]